MDRQIPKRIKDARRRKRIVRSVVTVASIAAAAVGIDIWISDKLQVGTLSIAEADRGVIEITVNAGGELAPLDQEIVVSPINSRILEVYKSAGERVEAGEPLLRLDLATVETEYLSMVDEREMRRSRLVRERIDLDNGLSELEMQGQIQAMKLDQLSTDLAAERYLDSLGAGTPDKVRRAELNHAEARLQLAQTNQRIANERKRIEAELKVQELELAIFEKSLDQSARLLEDSRILAPRSATLTFIDNRIGTPVTQGTQVATLSDLSRFRVEGEAADAYADRIGVGARATVEAGGVTMSGTVTHVTPVSSGGVVRFTVVPDAAPDAAPADQSTLRSGLRVNVYVRYGIEQNAVRLPYGSIFAGGPGPCDVWVVEGDRAVKRQIVIGGMSHSHVAVRSGIEPGERVMMTDMTAYKNRNEIKLKR